MAYSPKCVTQEDNRLHLKQGKLKGGGNVTVYQIASNIYSAKNGSLKNHDPSLSSIPS